MKTYLINNIAKFTRRLLLGSLMLFAVAGNALAQDSPFVIKKTKYLETGDDHYLAHVKVGTNWVLRDVTAFHPDSCLWYSGREISLSGTNHNYYFIDDANHYRFLSAPLQAEGSLSLSDSQPPVYLLNNTDQSYYFYDWDYDNWPEGAGLARGHQHNGVTEATCDFNWRDEQCWEVYWVELKHEGSRYYWELSDSYQYGINAPWPAKPGAGRFRKVTVTAHDMEVSGNGGLADLDDIVLEYEGSASPTASIEPFSYIPAYHQYDFIEVIDTIPTTSDTEQHTYYFPHEGTDITVAPVTPIPIGENPTVTYQWSISGAGADYLTLTNANTATPTLTYSVQNNDGHKTATLTLTVTYQDGSTQTTSCTVTVLTPCQNPQFSANVTYEDVVVSWTPTAESYTVSWKLDQENDWNSASVSGATSYTITGLQHNSSYNYKVKADCTPETSQPTPLSFTTLPEPQGLVYGAVFGGGRMADVGGKTEVVIINTDSIGAVYGGNDIAGQVLGADGSTITLGVNRGDAYATAYNNGAASTKVRVFDVYGGGNGYYLYNATTFQGAENQNVTLPNETNVKTLDGTVVWTNDTGGDYLLTIPTIVKTAITVSNDVVKVDSIFGGAKNAFITNSDADANGTSITVNDGTAYAVFGGNNYGGTQTDGKHYIAITGTTTSNNYNGIGRTFGIGYVFGGGNKVEGKTTDIVITGGMCDTVFGGGNAADVAAANVTVICVGQSHTITNAVSSWNGNNIGEINSSYAWNGTGIYNVRTLFGGNNRADMSGLPTINLTSGSVGTVYGGGNSGQMLAQIPDDDDPINDPGTGDIATDFGSNYIGEDKLPIYYGTHVVMNSDNMLVDYLYGGCQMSNVAYSTWVEVEGGHVGTVYGGCNIGGDVGSTRLTFEAGTTLTNEHKQAVQGATYVKASGGTIYGNLFAGANGFYHCNDGIHYIEGHNFAQGHSYIGLEIPTHNETHVVVSKLDNDHSVTVKGNVYAGGNMACVGFINATTNNHDYPTFRGLASLRMDGGTVEGSVYGGGCRASIFGSNEVKVSGGSIGYVNGEPTDGALYGGNDRSGQVAQITNRVFPSGNNYDVASDSQTSLTLMGVKTYVGLTGKPKVSTVYGGGNGAYQPYDPNEYCDITDQPVQSNTFVDINIDADGGEEEGGYINTVYGGGNGVTVLDRITVFVNVANMPTGESAYNQVGTIFGGNNKGDLDILSDIILLHGQVNTVYGGCNEGAMLGNLSYNGYDNLGSMVHLRSRYQPNGTGTPVTPDARVTGFVYGGCRSNGVTNNTLVLVEGGDHHTATFFGGSDVSGIIGGESHVVVKGVSVGTVVGTVYGAGNGDYSYSGGVQPPYSTSSRVDVLLGGTCAGSVYGGGLAGKSGETHVTINGGSVGNNVFGGGNEAGVVAANGTTGNSTITMNDGFVGAGVYGGCNEQGAIDGNVEMTFVGGTVGTEDNPAKIHGGGYGAATAVDGNIEINFGEIGEDNTYPLLYGEMYGGSALGNVNTDAENTTTINVDAGTVVGDIYGGGLGDASHAALVHGVVHVNIGYHEGEYGQESSLRGEATLIGCNVFGCNNVNGSPQSKVYVDVYRTAHIEGDNTIYDDDFAIGQVFGGGNHAHYAPLDVINPDSISDPNHQNNLAHLNRTHVYVHGCQNTINYVYGGGNAADALGVETIIEGGRFNEVYGGGNGRDIPANIGAGSLGIIIHGGHVNYFFEGCNKQGIIGGKQYEPAGTPEFDCGELIVDSYFFGDNEAEHIGDMENIIECTEDPTKQFNYKYVYAGSRWATIYGNVTLTVRGGHIENLFGGSKGYNQLGGEPIPADIKKFPTQAEIEANPDAYSDELKAYLVAHPERHGTGGNIILRVEGGTIGNVIGGCDEKGNVEGKITVIVESISNDCGLFVGNIYGASNETDYEPTGTTLNSPTPEVTVIEATVGGTATFASGEKTYEGNVFGGGNIGSVKANPKVVIGSTDSSKPVTIWGNVFGGGKLGRVDGNTEVIIVPTE